MTALPSSGAFTMVDPTHVAAVGPAAAVLYGRILWRAGESGEWAATRTMMAAETGLSEDTIRTAVRVLREREWVTSRRRSVTDATLVWRPLLAGHADMGKSPISMWGDSPSLDVGKSPISSLETGKTSNPPPPVGEECEAEGLFTAPEEEPTTGLRSVPTDEELSAEFDRFWGLYPRREGKKAARVAYARARRGTKGQPGATVHQIAGGLRRALVAWEGREARYVPHPTTWLNQGRWDDEVTPEVSAQPAGRAPVRDVVPGSSADTYRPPVPDYDAEGSWVRPVWGQA
ncbi:hypothetical protein Pam4_43 [Pseudanabaena phage Pam4]|nr:hypothetical protein Pam4_43 [Pseudanabaena phage Pam4]